MKKLVAIILCISLLLLSFPMSASAAGPYDINVLAGEGGKIALTEEGPPENGDIAVGEGSNVTLHIIPDSYYSIEDVMVDGISQGAVSQYTFNNVSGAHSVSATFTRNTKTITVAPVVNGEIRVNGSGESGTTVTVDKGSEVNIDVRPNANYEIESVTIGAMTYSLDGEIGDRTGEFSRTVTVNNNISVSAVFRYAHHTITTNVGPNGTVSPMNPKVNHGSDQTFTITPNSGYSIRSLTVDGNPASVDEHNQITLFNVQNDRAMSVDFAQAVTYTITTIAGPHGSVTPGNPTVAQGADITFTITPDPGYAIDELRVDGLPEIADESGQFTVFNVQRSMTLEVTFLQVMAHTISIPKYPYINVQIVGEPGLIPESGSVITRNTGEIVSYYIMPEKYYRLTEIIIDVENGEDQDVTYDYYYDEAVKKIRIDIETTSSHTLHIKTDRTRYQFSPKNRYAITSSDATSDTLIKNAIRRELALYGYDVQLADMTILARSSHAATNGVEYERIDIEYNRLHNYATKASVYIVSNYTDIIIYNGSIRAPEGQITIFRGSEGFAQNLIFEIPVYTQDYYDIFGSYGVEGINLSWTIDKTFPVAPVSGSNLFRVTSPFYKWQLHIVNKGGHVEKDLNWFPMTLIAEDALCMNAHATSEAGTQETFTWELDTFPHVNLDGATQEVFFGNDRVILEKPRDGIGDIASMTVAASNSPGYTFKNNSDGTITIHFLSDYYDKVTVPLTIVKQSGGTAKRNLIIHRVGVDIQAHNAADGNPSSTRTVFHGTQYGNLVNFADGKKYKITASYFIPDYGDNRPYGLYVTRKYANGKTETQIITGPMASPHPASADLFDPGKKVFIYNNGSSGWANVADYLIYSGTDAASAPVEISVLVLKDAPAAGNTFGGVDFGSGTGVKWTKP